MKKKVIVLIVILLLCAALLVWCLWGNTALTTTVIDVQAGEGLPAEFEGFRIAHVSDLHNAVFGDGNEKLLTLLREAEPDIIAVTGDLIDSRHTDVDAAVAFIASAAETAPVYYVTGNHEARLDFEDIEPRLAAAGAQVLRNSAVYIECGGGSIQLAGIDDPAFIRTGGVGARIVGAGGAAGRGCVLRAARAPAGADRDLCRIRRGPGSERPRPRRPGAAAVHRRAVRARPGLPAGV